MARWQEIPNLTGSLGLLDHGSLGNGRDDAIVVEAVGALSKVAPARDRAVLDELTRHLFDRNDWVRLLAAR